ncbi:Alkaline phosphatase, tissue-nonspecific isozyme [Armadillidium vulgare]|nr:Alkaline phosphatase, tissue-nonspecific isozyme [Armadillidium vulgare]
MRFIEFAGSSIPFAYERKNNSTIPSLKKLTEIAITRLSRNENGFFLMVEGGRIDHALHSSKAHAALMEIQELEEAVEAALNMTNIEDTLIIVTADHSHVMTINGYPSRGHDILGILADDFVRDNLPYATLMFTTGFGANYSWNGERVLRKNLTNVDTRDMNFVFPSAVPTNPKWNTRPMSHLFHRVHEQSYIAHVMAYSSCIGPFKNNCRRLVQDKQSNKEKNVQSKAGRGSSNKINIRT